LNKLPDSEDPGVPLVTVCIPSGSLLNHPTVVPIGTAMLRG